MRRRILVLIVLAVLCGGVAVLTFSDRGRSSIGRVGMRTAEDASPRPGATDQETSVAVGDTNTPRGRRHRQITPHNERILEDPLSDWRTPIQFYGKVVDESGQPVAGATVHFAWNDLSPEGTSRSETESDADGLFSLTGKTGKILTIQI